MRRSFYAGDIKIAILQLSKHESHHLCVVNRCRISEKIAVLNGNGTIAHGKLVEINKNQASIEVYKIVNHERAHPSFTLMQAVLMNNNNDYIVREATAIGVDRIIFFETQNSECKIKEKLPMKLSRWQAISIEACKQSANPFLPKILYYESLRDVVLAECETKMFAGLSQNSQPIHQVILQNKSAGSFCIAIGPEGDFTSAEYESLRKENFIECSLSKNTLRSETAAIYSLSILEQLLRSDALID